MYNSRAIHVWVSGFGPLTCANGRFLGGSAKGWKEVLSQALVSDHNKPINYTT